jgi:hypothetical protein
MKFFRLLLIAHASYIFVTAVWPLVNIESFMLVTGPKADIWLVKTVGALLIPISLCMFSYLRKQTPDESLIILASGTTISFICIDVYYATTDVISDIYLADAAVELLLLTGWIFVALRHKTAATRIANDQ